MRCTTAREQMTRDLREPLEARDREALDCHLAECPACRAEQAELLRLERALRSTVSSAAPAPNIRVDTAAVYAAARQPTPAPRLRWALAAGAAAALAVAGGYHWLVGPHSETASSPRRRQRSQPGSPVADRPPANDRLPVRRQATTEPGLQVGIPGPTNRNQVGHLPAVEPVRPRPELTAPKQIGPRFTRHQDIALRIRTPLPGLRTQAASLPEARREPGQRTFPPDAPGPKPSPIVAADGPRASSLRGDPRLAMTLSLDERDRPLGELLPEIGRRVGVPLNAGREVSDDRATLILDDTPAVDVLSHLAEHLGFTWTRDRERYELHQDLAAQRAEAALRRKELAPINAEIDLATRLLATPPELLKARLREQESGLKGELADRERELLQAEHQETLNALLAPAAVRASLTLFRALSATQVERLMDAGELRTSTADGTLSPELAELIYASTSLLEMTEGNLARVQADATIRLTDADDDELGPPPQANRHPRIEFRYTTIRGAREMPRYWGSQWIPQLPEAVGDDSSTEETQDPDLKATVDLTLPGPDRQPVPIIGGSPTAVAATGAVWPPRARVSDVAAAIHHATGMQVVADSFVGARIDPALLRGRQTLAHVLSALGRELDYRWKKTGRVLWLRDRRFYADRNSEVPERILRPFVTRTKAEGLLSLDELASLATGVTDPQVRSLERYWGWYLEHTDIMPPDWFFSRRQHLRFWASLSPAQRSSLRSGEVLAVPQMTPAQRELWAIAFIAPPENHRTPTSELHTPSAAEVASGGFSLRSAEVQQVLFLRSSPDGKKRFGSTITVVGPPSVDPRKYLHRDPGQTAPEPEVAGPQQSLDSYRFRFHLGARPEPARSVEILVPRVQKAMSSPNHDQGETR